MKKEVTIIGAGATGLSAGIFLNSFGYNPRIFEKRDRAEITKAIGINPITLQLLEKTGITNRFLKNGWKLDCMNFWYNDDLIYKNQFSKVNHPYPFMIIQPQFETEQILEDYLKEKNIVVERNFELLKIAENDSLKDLSFKNCADNSLFNLQTNGTIIGADGFRSKVRQEMGIEMKGWDHPSEYTLYDIELETPLSHKEGHYQFYKAGTLFMVHIRDGVWRTAGNLTNLLNYLPKGTKVGKIKWETNFRISEKVAQKYSSGNVHILGDAAHVHSPLGGKGMNMCIEDSYIFSELLSRNREADFYKLRRRKIENTVGILGQLTETVGGPHWLGRTMRSSMKPFSFLFPLFMPYMRDFLLGIK